MLQSGNFFVGHGRLLKVGVAMFCQYRIEGLVDERALAASGDTTYTYESTERKFY